MKAWFNMKELSSILLLVSLLPFKNMRE